MSQLFTTILYQPIFNAFVALYNVIPDLGIVIVIITVVIKLALYPMTKKSIAAQKSMQDLQPKMEAIKVTYKDDKQKLAEETMKLYKEHKVNPLGSCLPLLVQFPVFIALYYVLRSGLTTDNFDLLYEFVANPGHMNAISFGVDLSKINIPLAVLAAGSQYWQAKMMQAKQPPKVAGSKDEGMASMMNKQMLYAMPFITLIIGLQFPGGLTLYWFLSTLLTALQQKLMFQKDGGSGKDSDAIDGKIVG